MTLGDEIELGLVLDEVSEQLLLPRLGKLQVRVACPQGLPEVYSSPQSTRNTYKIKYNGDLNIMSVKILDFVLSFFMFFFNSTGIRSPDPWRR